ncbi:copper resistance protein CopC [Candidatus Protofrankia datiscae]|uniref:Copper resistance protein CopC n=2 Tax=Frankiaceae TaxID=74712 RepID=F8B006_9ACTN|nr:copper resistance protein CopC [Candidatus Protofrankia datiscae]
MPALPPFAGGEVDTGPVVRFRIGIGPVFRPRTGIGSLTRSRVDTASPCFDARWRWRRAARRVGFLLAAMLVAVVGTAVPASAHAVLEGSDPAGGSSQPAAPSRVTLTFSESVTVNAGSITVISASGQRVDDGAARHGQAGNEAVVGIRSGLDNGTYVVSWHVVSADSHPVSGGFFFGVGVVPDASAAASVSTTRGSVVVGVLAGVARFAAFAGLAVLVGAGLFLLALWPAGLGLPGPRRLLWAGWGVTFGSSVALLLLQGPYGAGQGLSALFRWDALSATLYGRYGHLVLLRTLALLLAVPLLRAVMAGHRRSLLELAGLALVATVTQSAARHAGVGDDAWLATANLTLHLLGVAAWGGGLTVLVIFLWATSRRVSRDGRQPPGDDVEVPAARAAELAEVLPKWSRVAMAAVTVIVLTGVYQTWREVGSLSALNTTYGRLLLVKLWFVAMMLGFGWLGHNWVARHHRPPRAALAADRADADATAGQAGNHAWNEVGDSAVEPAGDGRGSTAVGVAVQTVGRGPGLSGSAGSAPPARREAEIHVNRGRAVLGLLTGRAAGPPAARRNNDDIAVGPSGDASSPGLPPRPRISEGALARLRRGIILEVGVAAVVLGVTAVLVNSVPARTSYVPPFSDTVFAGPLTVQVDIAPTRRGPQTLHVYVFDPAGKAQPLAEASAALSLPDAGVGPLPVPLTQAAPGHVIGEGMQVPLPGTWQLRLTLRVNDFDQYVTTLFYRVR